MSRIIRIFTLVAIALILAIACAPQTVEVTRVVEVEVPGEPVTEQIEVTRIVEGETITEQIEVTRVVEVEGEAPVEGTAALLNQDVSGDIEIWHFWGSPVRRTAIRRIASICGSYLPNLQITETFKPFGDIWTANIAAVAAGSGMPDVIIEDRPQLPQRGRDQIATNLQPFIEQDNFDTSVFWPFAWEETLFEGNSYGIPFETDVRVLFWNKQAFEEAGLDPNDPPETWEELEAYADALDIQADDGSFTRIGFPLYNVGPDFWARTNGWQQVVDGMPNMTDPALIETLEWYKGWMDRYGGYETVENFRASFGAAPNDLFMSGAMPMFVDVAGYLSQLNFYRPRVTLADGSQVNMEWGVAPLPYGTEPANWSGGFAMAIPFGAENAEGAWEFIKCATSPEGQASWSRDTFAIPTNQESANSPELLADPAWATIMGIMEHSQGSTYVPGYPNFTEQFGTRWPQVMTGELTAQEAMEQAQEEINTTIEQSGTGG